jgi:hypothetical protein
VWSFLFVRLCKQVCNAAKQKSPRYREGFCSVGTTGLAAPIQKMGGTITKAFTGYRLCGLFCLFAYANKFATLPNKKALAIAKAFVLSGRLDSNQRPLAPHASALPGCATSRLVLAYLTDAVHLADWPAF